MRHCRRVPHRWLVRGSQGEIHEQPVRCCSAQSARASRTAPRTARCADHQIYDTYSYILHTRLSRKREVGYKRFERAGQCVRAPWHPVLASSHAVTCPLTCLLGKRQSAKAGHDPSVTRSLTPQTHSSLTPSLIQTFPPWMPDQGVEGRAQARVCGRCVHWHPHGSEADG